MTQFDKIFHTMKKPWVIFCCLALVIVLYQFADRPLAAHFYQQDFRTHVYWLTVITNFGKWQIYFGLFILTGLYFRYGSKNLIFEERSWFLLGCVFLPNLVGFALKIIVSRARPELLFIDNSYGFYWFKLNDLQWSFPSGHAITVVGLVSGLGVLFPKYFYILISIALLVIISRVFLYFHYLSDVTMGLFIGLFVVALFTQFVKKNHYLQHAFRD